MSRLFVYLVVAIFALQKLWLSLNLFILFNYQTLSLEC